VLLIVSESVAIQFSLAISKSTRTLCTDESTCHCGSSSLMVSESTATQLSMMISESTKTMCTDQSRLQV